MARNRRGFSFTKRQESACSCWLFHSQYSRNSLLNASSEMGIPSFPPTLLVKIHSRRSLSYHGNISCTVQFLPVTLTYSPALGHVSVSFQCYLQFLPFGRIFAVV